MDQTFSLGVPSLIPRNVPRPKSKISHCKKGDHVDVKDWLLIRHEDWVLTFTIQQMGSDISQVKLLAKLAADIRSYKVKAPLRRILFVPQGTEIKFLENAVEHVKKNQKLVNKLRPFLTRWLRRHFKNGNEEDLMTGEVPANPVTLSVWAQRTNYKFEPTTILRDIIERLLSHSYLFPKYLMPRNPYTNCIMTENEFRCVMDQLRRAGHSHWALEGLLDSGYDADVFKGRFGSTVKNHIFMKEFKNPSAETQEVIYDFIDSHHTKNNQTFSCHLYKWGLANQQNHHRIRAWIQLCRDHHLILYTDGNGKIYTAETERINKFAAQLCHDDANLSELWLKAVSPSRQDSESTVSSAQPVAEPVATNYIYIFHNTADYLETESWNQYAATYISLTLPTEFPSLHGFWPDDEFDGPRSDDASDGLESPGVDEPWDYS